jgi:2-aminobenzoylacetyl-CoA thioesterase
MHISVAGTIKDRFSVAGLATYPVHLLDCARPVLFDAGTACAGELYVESIRAILGERQPHILFISHVHWDHCGGASYLKRAFPAMKIAASRKATEILKRPAALELIAKLNANARSFIPTLPGVDPSKLIDEPFHPFEIDMEVKDGDVIEVDEGLTVQVMATPGHTRDHMSYYIPREGILVAAEASGCLAASGEIIPEFLADYDLYFASLRRLAALPARVLCQGHRVVFVGSEEVRSFFHRSAENALRFKTRVCELLEAEGGSIDTVVGKIKAEQWDPIAGVKQPEVPYLLNLTAQVTHLAGKTGRS